MLRMNEELENEVDRVETEAERMPWKRTVEEVEVDESEEFLLAPVASN